MRMRPMKRAKRARFPTCAAARLVIWPSDTMRTVDSTVKAPWWKVAAWPSSKGPMTVPAPNCSIICVTMEAECSAGITSTTSITKLRNTMILRRDASSARPRCGDLTYTRMNVESRPAWAGASYVPLCPSG